MSKASRAPGPISYVQLHANKAKQGDSVGGPKKKVNRSKESGVEQNGHLKKYLDLDEIPDFSWENADITVSEQRPSLLAQNSGVKFSQTKSTVTQVVTQPGQHFHTADNGREEDDTDYKYLDENDYLDGSDNEPYSYEGYGKSSHHNASHIVDEDDEFYENEEEKPSYPIETKNSRHQNPSFASDNVRSVSNKLSNSNAAGSVAAPKTTAPTLSKLSKSNIPGVKSSEPASISGKSNNAVHFAAQRPTNYENDDDSDIEDTIQNYYDSPPKKKASPKQPRKSKPSMANLSSPPPPLPCEHAIQENEATLSPPRKQISEQDKLFYTKQPRDLGGQFKPYTLQQYKLIKRNEYTEISNIQPDLNTDELIAKRQNLERIKQFSKQLRQYNREVITQAPKLPAAMEQNDLEIARQKYESKRQRALDFARNVPKPKNSSSSVDNDGVVVTSVTHRSQSANGATTQQQQQSQIQGSSRAGTSAAQNGPRMDGDDFQAAKLQELEARHEANRQKVQAMKKMLGGHHINY